LALGEPARAVRDARHHFVVIIFAGEKREGLTITDGLPGRATKPKRSRRRPACGQIDRRAASRHEAPDLVDKPSRNHGVHSGFNSPVQFLARAPQDKDAALISRPAFLELQLLMTDRLAGGSENLQRAY
jgi:hypothetical protein